MSATVKPEKEHFSVLLNELVSIISPLYSGTFIDCTFGQGGVSEKILQTQYKRDSPTRVRFQVTMLISAPRADRVRSIQTNRVRSNPPFF